MALQEMSCKLQRQPNAEDREEKKLQQSSNKCTSLVNGVGLCVIRDEIADLFVTIELLVNSKLSQTFKECGKVNRLKEFRRNPRERVATAGRGGQHYMKTAKEKPKYPWVDSIMKPPAIPPGEDETSFE